MKKTRDRSLRLLNVAVLGILLGTCTPVRQTPVGAPSPKVVVLPFAIEPRPITGAPGRPEPAPFIQVLAEEAVSSAERTLARNHAWSVLERRSSEVPPDGAVRIAGVVRLPVSLPGEVKGLAADSRRGPLAVATVRLIAPDGKTIREAEATLTWREASWLEGGPRFRRLRPVDQVLREVVREVVEKTVERL